MTDALEQFRWRIHSHSVRGTSHDRDGRPNQDSVAITSSEAGRVVAAAVADGHGSRKSFRSDRGSRLAVQCAIERLFSFLGPEFSLDDADFRFQHDIAIELPRQIVRDWQQLVDADIATQPISKEEQDGLSTIDCAALAANPRLAYGSTLVAALVLPLWVVYLQLGDGDILTISDQSSEATRPLPPDPLSFANETASLSSPGIDSKRGRPGEGNGPWADFRVRVLPMSPNVPSLILLTTDGYPNAFVNDAAFKQVAADILSLCRSDGWDYVCDHLPGWLEEASTIGSGDDVTVALLIRDDSFNIASPASAANGEVNSLAVPDEILSKPSKELTDLSEQK